jgi:hypothetical protein
MSANKYPFKSGSIGYVIMCYGKMRTHRRPFSAEDFRQMKIDKPPLNEINRSIDRLVLHRFLAKTTNSKYVLTGLGEQYLYALAKKNRTEMEAHVSERNRQSGMKGFLKQKTETV